MKFGAFIDTYYAYDFNNPKNHEREYTTQPARSNEFNINLAYIEAVAKGEKTRGRLALQFGNSVTKNYSSEPTQGKTSGDKDSKFIQEAYVGRKIGEKTWIDMGIFLGNIGMESWISKDNATYTRSLFLDYVPYYSAGVRLEHELDEKQTVQLQLLNGWQNISENNTGKAVAFQYKNMVNEKTTFVYNNFFGDEEVVSTAPRFRSYHNFVFDYSISEKWRFLSGFDFGHQSQQENDGVDSWYATSLNLKQTLDSMNSLTYRVEYFNDPHQANVVTNTANGFEVFSSSVNYDYKFDEYTMWRTELRGFYSKDKIYPTGSKYFNRLDGFLVTSLSLSL
ncbi:MAG: outer membrane beta-barrel protein [Bacteriovoracaceae bacterium]